MILRGWKISYCNRFKTKFLLPHRDWVPSIQRTHVWSNTGVPAFRFLPLFSWWGNANNVHFFRWRSLHLLYGWQGVSFFSRFHTLCMLYLYFFYGYGILFHFYKIKSFNGSFSLQKHSKTAQSLLLGSADFERIWFYLMFALSNVHMTGKIADLITRLVIQ